MVESKKISEHQSSLNSEYRNSIGSVYNMIDFRSPDMIMYGKVDKGFNSIIPKNNSDNFELLEPGVHVFNFVADAYRDFDAHIQETKIKAGERLPSEFLSKSGVKRRSFFLNLKPVSGYADTTEMHSVDIDFIFDAFISYINFYERHKRIDSPEHFIKYFVNFSLSDYYPEVVSLTKSSYMRKSIVPYDASGLVIKFANDDPDDLNQTMERYTFDPVFKFYANESRKFGFYVDYYAPWTLVANVGSAAMKNYMARRNIFFSKNGATTGETGPGALGHVHKYRVDQFGNGVTTMTSEGPDHVHEIKNWALRASSIKIDGEPSMAHGHAMDQQEFFTTYYDKACDRDIEHIKNVIHNMYNTFVNLYTFQQKRLIHDMQVHTQGAFRQKLTRQQFNDLYPDTFWARFYLDLRINEDRVFIAKNRYQSIARQLLSICSTEGTQAAANFVNDEIIKRIHYMLTGPNRDRKWKTLPGRGTFKKMAEHFT
tara:strand:- start:7734 stop:9182 length:1449 start_codon:yes stop_codon:yes gene_type:complete